MFLTIVLCLITSASVCSVVYFTHFYNSICHIPVAIVAVPIIYIVLFGLVLLTLLIVSKTINVKKEVDKPSKVAQFIVREIISQLVFFAGIRAKETGFRGLDKKRNYMIVYNHTSNWDPMYIITKLTRMVCITKPENKHIPICGPFIHKAGYISIDRENDSEGIKSILKAIEFSEKYHVSICVSPEGTRSLSGDLLPFRPGCFNIAKRTNMPILVIGFKNMNKIHLNEFRRITRVRCDVLGVIDPVEHSEMSTSEISNKIHSMYEIYQGEQK